MGLLGNAIDRRCRGRALAVSDEDKILCNRDRSERRAAIGSTASTSVTFCHMLEGREKGTTLVREQGIDGGSGRRGRVGMTWWQRRVCPYMIQPFRVHSGREETVL